MESGNPYYSEAVGGAKEAANAAAGILKIVNDHASGIIPAAARQHMQSAAAWLAEQGKMKGWTDPGGFGEHSGAMGADYLGFEAIASLLGMGGAGASSLVGGTEIAKTLKQAANVAETFDKLHPVLKQAAGIGLRAIHAVVPAARTAAAGGVQSYLMSGGDKEQGIENAILSGAIHMGAGAGIGPLGEYLARLKSEAAAAVEAAKPLAPPIHTPAEPPPTPPAPAAPAARPPAAERFAAHEQEAAQGMTAEQLADLNKYRAVDESGTPTNIQQLGLPSQSATEPYQFRIPGWSQTEEAGDLLHEAGARYKQVGTRVVEGKGSGNRKPWEGEQVPFDLPRYAEEPGAVFSTERNGVPSPEPQPPEPTTPPRESSPMWLQQGPEEPPTSPFSHKEPIMQATEYKTSVRPGSVIRQDTTTGGPSILTTDADLAARHLDRIESIVQDPNFSRLPPARQADILQSHNDVMQQMREYQQLLPQHEYSPYLHQPTFAPVDVDTALSRVGDMGDAAEEMMRGPKEMYNQWENLTKDRPGGSFRTINDEMNDLIGKTGQASRQRLAALTDEMHQMFNGSDPYLGRAGTPTDLAIARSQFNNGYLVKRVDDAFTKAFEGADRTGNFNVRKLQAGWKSLVNDVGAPRMSNTLGPERYEAMNNMINDLAGEPAADKAATAAAKAEAAQQHQGAMEEYQQKDQQRQQVNKANVAEYKQKAAAQEAAANAKQKWYYDLARNGWHHIATGAGMEGVANIVPRGILGAVTHKVGAALILKQIITHPLMAKLAYQAARAGTNPGVYAPVFADIIRKMHEAPPPETDTADEPQETQP
jgi:hypothetical protein